MTQSGSAADGAGNFTVTPLSGTSVRATNFEVRFDGGAFTLHMYEHRESAEPRNQPAVARWDLVEVGRFALSPVALKRLLNGLQMGQRAYVAAMGHELPDEQRVLRELKRLSEEAPNR